MRNFILGKIVRNIEMNVYNVGISNKKNMNLKIEKRLKNIENNTFNTTRIKLTNLGKFISKTEEKQMVFSFNL